MTENEASNLKKIIDGLCDLEDGLTDWEVDFVENVSHQKPEHLSSRQIETIHKIHDKVMG